MNSGIFGQQLVNCVWQFLVQSWPSRCYIHAKYTCVLCRLADGTENAYDAIAATLQQLVNTTDPVPRPTFDHCLYLNESKCDVINYVLKKQGTHIGDWSTKSQTAIHNTG